MGLIHTHILGMVYEGHKRFSAQGEKCSRTPQKLKTDELEELLKEDTIQTICECVKELASQNKKKSTSDTTA